MSSRITAVLPLAAAASRGSPSFIAICRRHAQRMCRRSLSRVAFGKPIAFSANSDRKLITRQAEAEVRRLFDASRGYAQ